MHAHELAEQVAALVLLGVAMYVLPASWLARRRAQGRPAAAGHLVARLDRATMDSAARALAAALAVGAGAIHLALALGPLHDSPPRNLALGGIAAVETAVGGLALSGHLFRARGLAVVVVAGIIFTASVSSVIGSALGAGSSELAGGTAIAFGLGLLAVLVAATPARLQRTVGSRMEGVTSVAIVPAVGILLTVALLMAVSVNAGSPAGHEHSAAPVPDGTASRVGDSTSPGARPMTPGLEGGRVEVETLGISNSHREH